MTHLDTLRRMRDARPSHRCGGCELCRERAALEEAIRVMEREADDAKATREYEAALLRGSVWRRAVVTDEKLAEIEARANGATKWAPDKCKVRPVIVDDDGHSYRPSPPECTYLPGTNVVFSGGYENGGNDWAFLAHARSDIPLLCEEVRRLRADGEWLRRMLRDIRDCVARIPNAPDVRVAALTVAARIDAALRGES